MGPRVRLRIRLSLRLRALGLGPRVRVRARFGLGSGLGQHLHERAVAGGLGVRSRQCIVRAAQVIDAARQHHVRIEPRLWRGEQLLEGEGVLRLVDVEHL